MLSQPTKKYLFLHLIFLLQLPLLLEVKQAGIFAIKGLEAKQLTHIINTTCPNILFPYAREAVDSVLSKGSFPALMLPPINFDALFASALKQAEEETKASKDETETKH